MTMMKNPRATEIDMFLSPSQIADLTTRRTKPAQRRQLDAGVLIRHPTRAA